MNKFHLNKIFTVLLIFIFHSCGKEPYFKKSLKTCFFYSANIHGGNRVQSEKWISTVALTRKINGIDTLFCSGALLTNNLVITAAHCLESVPEPYEKHIKVYIGNGEENGYSPGQYDIIKAKKHPAFIAKPYENNIYDFAYLVLAEELNLSYPYIFPAIYSHDDIKNLIAQQKEVTIVGFGATESMEYGIKYEVNAKIKTYGETELFIGGNGKDSCYGDSGGPVYIELEDKKIFLFAIASRGGTCGEGGLYTQIPVIVDWLKKDMDLDLPAGQIHVECE